MTGPNKSLKIQTIGPFTVTGPEGEDLTPRGAKARGLMAILALTDEMTRPRRFLEEKLWSGRQPEQAGQSLRQALTEIRRALGDHKDAFEVDRSSVSFAEDTVWVDFHEENLVEDGHELLEGLKIRDKAFTAWLKEVREAFARRKSAHAARARGLVLRANSIGEGPAGVLGDVLSNQIGENIAEQVRAWRQVPVRVATGEDDDAEIEIETTVVEQNGSSLAFIKLIHAATGRVLHSQKAAVDASSVKVAGEDLMADVTIEAAEKALDAMAQAFPSERPEIASASLGRRAVREMETFEAPRLEVADRLLRSAFDIDHNGLFLAWHSLLKTIQLTELVVRDEQAEIEEIVEMNRKALELDGGNPLVQALVNQVQVLKFADIEAANATASARLDNNLAGAFGMVSLASANMWTGDRDAAYNLTRKASRIVGRSSFHHWWDTFHCISCIASNRFDEAIQFGESASRAAPHFRPPLRHLLALYANTGQHEKVETIAARLKRLEPDFSLSRFKEDGSYPVRTLRLAGLLDFPVETE